MLFLTGLLAMMALGSIVIVSTGPSAGDDPDGVAPQDDPDAQDEAGAPHHLAVPEDAGRDGSLFARLGLINMADEGGSPVDEEGAQDTATDLASWLSGGVSGESAGSDAFPHDEEAIADLHADAAAWGVDVDPSLADLQPDAEQVIVVYDDSDAGGDPRVEIRIGPDDPEMTEILVDGAVLSTMPTAEAPTLDSIVVMGESVMQEMALA